MRVRDEGGGSGSECPTYSQILGTEFWTFCKVEVSLISTLIQTPTHTLVQVTNSVLVNSFSEFHPTQTVHP